MPLPLPSLRRSVTPSTPTTPTEKTHILPKGNAATYKASAPVVYTQPKIECEFLGLTRPLKEGFISFHGKYRLTHTSHNGKKEKAVGCNFEVEVNTLALKQGKKTPSVKFTLLSEGKEAGQLFDAFVMKSHHNLVQQTIQKSAENMPLI
jgi:hypothetical protein